MEIFDASSPPDLPLSLWKLKLVGLPLGAAPPSGATLPPAPPPPPPPPPPPVPPLKPPLPLALNPPVPLAVKPPVPLAVKPPVAAELLIEDACHDATLPATDPTTAFDVALEVDTSDAAKAGAATIDAARASKSGLKVLRDEIMTSPTFSHNEPVSAPFEASIYPYSYKIGMMSILIENHHATINVETPLDRMSPVKQLLTVLSVG